MVSGQMRSLPAVHASAAIEIAYRRRLTRLIESMHRSLSWWIGAAYRQNAPELARLAADASPARVMVAAIRRLRRQWERQFDALAKDLAAWFAKEQAQRSDTALRSALRRGGFSVRFTKTRAMNDAYQAIIAENVGLIKSIPQQYLTQVEGMVMRSVQSGRDLAPLAKDLQDQFGVTKRRAALISRDQNNKASAVLLRVRHQELGITHARWVHSRAGKTPRPSHVKASQDGVVYEISTGWYDPDEGQRIWPGTLINCFPGDTVVSLKTMPIALWRTFFNGPMIHIKVGTDLLQGTPNHPILTSRGWVPMGRLQNGDQVVCMAEKGGCVVDDHEDDCVTTFSELFEACASALGYVRRDGVRFDFHGHRPEGDVDEIIVVDHHLTPYREFGGFKDVGYLCFAESDPVSGFYVERGVHEVTVSLPPGGSDMSSSLLGCLAPRALSISAASPAHQPLSEKDIANVAGSVARRPDGSRDSSRTKTRAIKRDDSRHERRIPPIPSMVYDDAEHLESLAQIVGIATNDESSIFQCRATAYEFRRVVHKSVRNFSGHVYTMQTLTGHYSVGAASIQAKNCRCVAVPIMPVAPVEQQKTDA